MEVKVSPGQDDWDELGHDRHRAMNIGEVLYEEITVFFLAHPNDVTQPGAAE